MKFCEYLREIRLASGYTQQEIANVLQIDRSTYAYYESGKTEPNIANLRKISNLYSMSLDDLLWCNLRPVSLKLASPSINDFNALQSLRRLSRSEQNLVLMFRACENKEQLLHLIRDFIRAEDNDEDEQ